MSKVSKRNNYLIFFSCLALLLASCSSSRQINKTQYIDVQASYYHKKFNGKKTASGEKFHNSGYTAAHRTLPFGTKVKVTNPKNRKSVTVRINDRGPFIKSREIDLTKKAFMKISDHKGQGIMRVNINVLKKK